MSLSGTLRALLRRWYIALAGVIVACVAGYGMWTHTPPLYERTATQLLIPGVGSLPSAKSNPYLYLGGLLEATDVVARVAGNNETVADLLRQHPDTTITVGRDTSTYGPVITATVSSSSDAVASEVLDKVVAQTAVELQRLQAAENIDPRDRISVRTLTVDQEPTLEQRKRLVATGGASVGIFAFSLVLASLIDGLVLLRRRGKGPRAHRLASPETASEAVAAGDGAVDEGSPDSSELADSGLTEDNEPDSAVEPLSEPRSAKVLEPVSRRH